MSIGELFVNLGIKGAEKTLGALGAVRKLMGETAGVSLEAKAGILAAMYAMERLFAASGAAGTNLTNFNALTGMSTKGLQQLQYAGRQAGVSMEETAGSLKAVQNAMANTLLGKGAPEGFAMVANKVGLKENQLRDTAYVFQQLQKYAQAVPEDVGNVQLKSFGLSESVIAAMRRNAYNAQNMAKAPAYGDKEIATLDRANIAWSNLGNKIEMAVGHFNAKHGLQLVTDISKITDQVLRLVEALTALAEKFKIFQLIGKSFQGWNLILDGLNNGGLKTAIKDAPGVLKEIGKDIFTPNTNALPQAGKAQHVEINQNLHFQHDGKEHQKNSESHKKAIKDAYRQLQSQVQGS